MSSAENAHGKQEKKGLGWHKTADSGTEETRKKAKRRESTRKWK